MYKVTLQDVQKIGNYPQEMHNEIMAGIKRANSFLHKERDKVNRAARIQEFYAMHVNAPLPNILETIAELKADKCKWFDQECILASLTIVAAQRNLL